MSIVEIVYKYKSAFLSGISVTLQLCIVIWITGLFIGLVLGVIGYREKGIKKIIELFNFFLAGIPVLVLLFWIHYPLQTLLNFRIDPFISTAFTLSLINIFSVASTTVNLLAEIPKEYTEMAIVCNIPKKRIYLKIIFPLLYKMAAPSLLSLQVNMLHLTLFGSLISVEEIFRISQQINAEIYQPVEVYSALAIFFLIATVPVNFLAIYLKKKFRLNEGTFTKLGY